MKRAFLGAAVALLLLRLILMHLLPGWNNIDTDFPNYYTAAWIVSEGRPTVDLYDPVSFDREWRRFGVPGETALFNYFTPFSALTMLPVARFEPITAKRIWIALSLGCLGLAVTLTSRMTGVGLLGSAAVALAAGDALGNNLTFGQFYLVLTALLVMALAWNDRWPRASGVALALGVVTKVFPLVLLGYFAWTRRWKATLWTIVFICVATAIGLFVLGWVPHRVYLEEVLERVMRGEIQDPYHVRWNSWHALIRRAFVGDPVLNPAPIADVPALYFFLRFIFTSVVTVFTFSRIRRSDGGNRLLEYGVLVAMISLITPSQASYHNVLLFPAIVAAVAAVRSLKAGLGILALYALICSNYMGATTTFDSGPSMVLAFPRAYLMLVMWGLLLVLQSGTLGSVGGALRQLRVPLRTLGMVAVVLAVIGAVSTYSEWNRWRRDVFDGAVIAQPDRAGFLDLDPTVGEGGLLYSSLQLGGYNWIHPSASGRALVYESPAGIRGRLSDGTLIELGDGFEPVLGPESALAIEETPDGSAVVEFTGAGWVELLRTESVIHDLAVSPDNAKVAFSELVGGRYRVSEWFRATGARVPLLAGSGDYRYATYSPDGGRLAFATNSSGNWEVAEYSFSDGKIENRTTSLANDLMPVYAIDGRTIYFASDRRRGYRFTTIFKIRLW